jgi:hypothetical protein
MKNETAGFYSLYDLRAEVIGLILKENVDPMSIREVRGGVPDPEGRYCISGSSLGGDFTFSFYINETKLTILEKGRLTMPNPLSIAHDPSKVYVVKGGLEMSRLISVLSPNREVTGIQYSCTPGKCIVARFDQKGTSPTEFWIPWSFLNLPVFESTVESLGGQNIAEALTSVGYWGKDPHLERCFHPQDGSGSTVFFGPVDFVKEINNQMLGPAAYIRTQVKLLENLLPIANAEVKAYEALLGIKNYIVDRLLLKEETNQDFWKEVIPYLYPVTSKGEYGKGFFSKANLDKISRISDPHVALKTIHFALTLLREYHWSGIEDLQPTEGSKKILQALTDQVPNDPHLFLPVIYGAIEGDSVDHTPH